MSTPQFSGATGCVTAHSDLDDWGSLKVIKRGIVLLLMLVLGAATAGAASILSTNSVWRYLKGQTEASSPDPVAWRTMGFSDAAWSQGAAPFYYDSDQSAATGYHGNTVLNDMKGGYTCIFMRGTFVVTNAADYAQLQLGALSDDGFIAWINGVEVARFNMPAGSVAYNGASLPALAEPVPYQFEVLENPSSYLAAGTNVIAVQAFNSSIAGSSDFLIWATLSFTQDTQAPVVASRYPTAGATVIALSSIEADFDKAVEGVDAGDLLINGSPATNVIAYAPWQYVFEFAPASTGSVSVTWAPGHGIHDLTSFSNAFAGGGWSYTVDPNAPPPMLRINEFMADNKETLHDEDGDSSDWIEIYNPGSTALNLLNWSLTDDSKKPDQWRFPAVTLATNSYLVVFASGKNRTNASSYLHTNFKLGAAGSYLALVDPAQNVVSAFLPAYPAQQTDVSYGRDRLNPALAGYFSVPTPGGPNNASGPNFAPEVKFSRAGGNFANGFQLQLYTASSNAVIRYTLDRSLPTEASPIATGPLNISTTVEVRARAFETGLLPGSVHTETYIQLNSNLLGTSSDLPAVVIHNFGAGAIPVADFQFASVSIHEPENGRTWLTNTPTLSARAGLHVRGSTTRYLAKQSWALEFWDDYNGDKTESPLGLPAESDWVLYAPDNYDNALLHNPLIYRLSNEIGRYAPRTRFVEVYLNTSGGALSSANYNGIYVLEERIKPGPGRVDIDKLQPENSTSPSVTGGYLMKIDRTGPGETGFSAAGQTIVYVDPDEQTIKTPQRAAQKSYLQSHLNSFGTALNGSSYKDPLTGYRAYIDTGAWIDHHFLNVVSFNVDALRLSAYFYKPRLDKLRFGPIWDFDRSQGSTDGRDFNPRFWRSTVGDTGTDFFNYTWWGRMFTDIDFWQAWIDRYQDLRAGIFSTNHLFSVIDELAAEVRAEQPRETTRWPAYTSPRSGTVSTNGYSYFFNGSYQAELNFLKQWYRDRLNFIDTNFLGRPVFSLPAGPISPGAVLSLSGPSGATIYYTTNGVDPRASGGGLAIGARVYGAPLTLAANARVVARAYQASHANLTGANNPPLSSPWSGALSSTYIAGIPSLAISEIMYHPAPPPAGSTNNAEDFEYVELRNIGGTTISLLGVSFTNGINYTFTTSSGVTNLAAGATAVLVRNRAAFLTRYPNVTNIAGEYAGSLDNSGERIALVGAFLEPIQDFKYSDEWYPITDGFGFSLVAADIAETNDWSSASNWRPSAQFGGSPGSNDPLAPSFPSVVVNEALTHTDPPQLDAVELYNDYPLQADIGNWYLTDDYSDPRKYRFPPGTTIEPFGYLVVDESSFNNGSVNSFRLSSLGEDAYIFSGDAAGNLTGYHHGFSFGAAPHGVSFGRHVNFFGGIPPNGGPQEFFVLQRANTLGSENAGPLIGPVIFNEIMYDPAPLSGTNNDTIDEYIELLNIYPGPTPLFDPAYPTNQWKLTGGADFVFPPNITMPRAGTLLVVGFDPIHQPAQLAAFRSKYGIGTNTMIFGPWSGNLDNHGERLKLMRPDEPQPPGDPNAGLVPYILVDQVTYSNQSPWFPAYAEAGNSLQRYSPNSFGDDPHNWFATTPSPGATLTWAAPIDYDRDLLADDWELAHGLDPFDASGTNGYSGDPDGDGFNNYAEYISGTDPTDPASFLRIDSITATNGLINIHFQAVAGVGYGVLFSGEPGSETWNVLTNVDPLPSSQMMTITDTNSHLPTNRYYRLVLPEQTILESPIIPWPIPRTNYMPKLPPVPPLPMR